MGFQYFSGIELPPLQTLVMEVRCNGENLGNIWTTGKVTDYLTYRNEVTDVAESVGGHEQKEQQKYESVCDSDGHGFNSHACQ